MKRSAVCRPSKLFVYALTSSIWNVGNDFSLPQTPLCIRHGLITQHGPLGKSLAKARYNFAYLLYLSITWDRAPDPVIGGLKVWLATYGLTVAAAFPPCTLNTRQPPMLFASMP